MTEMLPATQKKLEGTLLAGEQSLPSMRESGIEMPTDADLARVIETVLTADRVLVVSDVRVSVSIGRVTLEGCVPTYRRKLATEELAASFEGVREIANRLTVKPPELIPDKEVAAKVRAAIDSSADVDGRGITVLVSDGVVTLRGAVRSLWEQANAEDVARSARGVREIHSSLSLNRVEESERKLSGKEVETVLTHVRGLKDTRITVAASNGEVVLCGEVCGIEQKRTAETVVQRLGSPRVRNGIVVRGHR